MLERRAVSEFRADARKLSGVAIRYGDTATIYGRLRERFEPGAFGDLSGTRLDVMHDRRRIIARVGAGLVLQDSAEALRFEAELPATREADDTLELVRRGVLRGASIEFLPISERLEDRTRVISAADLPAVSIVDDPAYKQSTVEARRRLGRVLRGGYDYRNVHVVSASGKLRKTRLKASSLDFALDDPEREISLNLGSSLDGTLGTRSSGTLKVTKRGTDGLDVQLDSLPDTQAARDLIGLNEAGIALYARPRYSLDGVPDAYVDVPEPGNPDVLIREVNQALLLGFDLTIRGRGNGYRPIELSAARSARRRFYA